MKRVCKNRPGPQVLQDYTQAYPDATWDQMRNDKAAHDCRELATRDQHELCAYCEQKISTDDPLHCRIEHFHPKSDKTGMHNWSLDWGNMLAVCDGGSRASQEEQKTHPLPANLSCDAHKNHMIQMKKLPATCEGYLLNPLDVPSFPNLFALDKGIGYFKPDEISCATVEIPGNACGTTAELVNRTIASLNLNCERLAEKRRLLVVNIDKNKKVLRQKGISSTEVPEKLISRYFSAKWPEFFTTLRCCLGPATEDYLKSMHYRGY